MPTNDPRTADPRAAQIQADRLYGKFRVERVDGRDQPGGDKANARYFVLDHANDPYARVALSAYADACRAELPGLAEDLAAELVDAVHAAGRDGQGEAEPLTTPQQHAPDCQCPACEFAPSLAADLAKVTRERDSLDRRCAVRFEEAEQLRARVSELLATIAASENATTLVEANEKIAAYQFTFREHRAIYERALARWRLDDIQRRAIAHPGLDGLLDWLLVQADEQRQRADQAEARGYARAVAALRDDSRYGTWWSAREYRPEDRYWTTAPRNHLADYLEAVGPDGTPAHGVAVDEATLRQALTDIDTTTFRRETLGEWPPDPATAAETGQDSTGVTGGCPEADAGRSEP